MNPVAVCIVRAVPTYSGGLSYVTAAENWAESATTVTPHTSSTGVSRISGASKSTAANRAILPETIIAAEVTKVLP